MMLAMWCALRESVPRVLLKTACSGAPRTKEYDRAISLFVKGQHPKSSIFAILCVSDVVKSFDAVDRGSLDGALDLPGAVQATIGAKR